MTGYITDIETKTLENSNFRQVLFTGVHSQLVVMTIAPGEDIGTEVHHHVDQFLRVESGTGKAVLNGQETEIKDGSAIIVPAGVEHNIINTSDNTSLKLYTVYSPPNHPDGTIHVTRADAIAAEEHE